MALKLNLGNIKFGKSFCFAARQWDAISEGEARSPEATTYTNFLAVITDS